MFYQKGSGMARSTSRWLLPLASSLILIIAILLSMRLPARFVTPPGAAQLMGAAAAWTDPHAASPSPVPEPTASTPEAAPFTLVAMPETYSDKQMTALQQPLMEALRYVEERTGIQLKAPVKVTFSNERGCTLSGVAYTDIREIKIFLCPETEADRVVSVLAHEFVHQLANDRYDAPIGKIDLILNEGIAQWGAGKYKLGDKPDFRTLVHQQYNYDLLPLTTNAREVDSLTIVRHIYDQWASLVEWTITTHGREAFDQLYVSGDSNQPGSADFEGVLGVPLDVVEQQWEAWLQQ